MKKLREKYKRQGESGNVLFLILIAVALFAALSYAVTQSSRSGGGDAGAETNLVNSAQITQYPASVRTSILRMIISSSVDVTSLKFNSSGDFGGCTGVEGECVFHPLGGGATSLSAPPNVMESGNQGPWSFNGDFEIINIGTSDAGVEGGNDIIAFLPGITLAICNQINDRVGIGTTIPIITASIAGVDGGAAGYLRIMDDGQAINGTEIVLGTGGQAGTNIDLFDGQPFGCFHNNPAGVDNYVYFHVLVER